MGSAKYKTIGMGNFPNGIASQEVVLLVSHQDFCRKRNNTLDILKKKNARQTTGALITTVSSSTLISYNVTVTVRTHLFDSEFPVRFCQVSILLKK